VSRGPRGQEEKHILSGGATRMEVSKGRSGRDGKHIRTSGATRVEVSKGPRGERESTYELVARRGGAVITYH
jgi:hypothetical protein